MADSPSSRGTAKPRRVADRLAETLRSLGTQVVFGLPGGAISPLYDALAELPEVRLVITKSENGAITAASAYARHSGRVGVVLVTSGPGILNALNGLASAQREGISLVLIGGDVSRAAIARNAVQDGSSHGLGIVNVTRPLCAAVFDIVRPSTADASLRQAFAIARAERPNAVFINLPMDVGLAPDDATAIAPVDATSAGRRIDLQSLRNLHAALSAAKHPLVIVGNGTRIDGAQAAVVALAESYGVPVATTPKAKGVFPETHPLSLGIYGHGGHASASEYIEADVDVLLVLGSSMNDAATHGWNAKLQAAMLIQVDVDRLQLGRNYVAHQQIVGRVGEVVEQLLELTAQRPPAGKKFGVTYDGDASTSVGADGLVAPQRAIHELQRLLPDDAIYTCDIGEHLMFVTHFLRLASADSYFVMTGHASMGTAIASATGIKLAKASRAVTAFVGDGGFVMSLADVNTAAQERLPIVIAVMNDFRYGMVELGHRKVYGRELKYPVEPLDICKLAEGCGAAARLIRAPADFAALDLSTLLRNGPLVLDIRIDPSVTLSRVDRFEKR